jgi:hypothetical protein
MSGLGRPEGGATSDSGEVRSHKKDRKKASSSDSSSSSDSEEESRHRSSRKRRYPVKLGPSPVMLTSCLSESIEHHPFPTNQN